MYDLYQINAKGTGGKSRLTDNLDVVDMPIAWSPDKTKIVFTIEEGNERDLLLMNRDGTGITPLNVGEQPNYWPTWSPFLENQP